MQDAAFEPEVLEIVAELYNCPEKLARCHRHSGNFGCEAHLPVYMVSFAAPRLLKRLPGCFAPGGEIVALRCFAKIETFVAQGASPGMDICWSMCLAGVGGEVDLHWGPSCFSASGYVREALVIIFTWRLILGRRTRSAGPEAHSARPLSRSTAAALTPLAHPRVCRVVASVGGMG